MRKNGSRIISFARYRATDLLLFAVILAAFDVISFFAFTKWFSDDSSRYIFSLAVPIALLVMVRWNWYGLFYAVGDGLLYCILLLATGRMPEGAVLQFFLVYCLGNAFVGLAFLMVRFAGYKRIIAKWYFTVLYLLAGWVAVLAGKVVISVCCGADFVSSLLGFLGAADMLSLAMGLIILLIMRRLDGMMENQRDYLLRLDKERKEKMMADNFGEQPIEIDVETLKTLNKKGDDLFGGK